MDRHDFTNHLKVLYSIDADEFFEARGPCLREVNWTAFRHDPVGYLIRAEDDVAARLWALVESRCEPVGPEFEEVPDFLDPLAKLEPEAQGGVYVSAAISLKRIADAMTGNDPGVVDVFEDAGAAFRKGWNR